MLLDGEEDYDVTIQQIEMSKSVNLRTVEKEESTTEKVSIYSMNHYIYCHWLF